jgi:hypothetical protein
VLFLHDSSRNNTTHVCLAHRIVVGKEQLNRHRKEGVDLGLACLAARVVVSLGGRVSLAGEVRVERVRD